MECTLTDWIAQVLSQSYQTRSLPGRDEFTASMLWTTAAVLLLPNLLAILMRKKSRKLLLDTLESILAVVLVIILLGIVLGLPVGKVFSSTHHCAKRSMHHTPSVIDRGQCTYVHHAVHAWQALLKCLGTFQEPKCNAGGSLTICIYPSTYTA